MPPVSGIAAASSAVVNPAQILIIPARTQASRPRLTFPVVLYMTAALKNTPEPITTPTTVENAPKNPISFFKFSKKLSPL